MFLPFLVPVVNNTGGELDICLSKRLVAFFPPAFAVRGGEKHRQNFGVVLFFLIIGQWSHFKTETRKLCPFKAAV